MKFKPNDRVDFYNQYGAYGRRRGKIMYYSYGDIATGRKGEYAILADDGQVVYRETRDIRHVAEAEAANG